MKPRDVPLSPLAQLAVRNYRDSDRTRWEEFVSHCPQATFFHRIGWKDINESVLRHRTHYLLAERAGAVVGVLPLVEVKSLLFGHALVSAPFAAHCGVAALDADAAAVLRDAAVWTARGLGVAHLELRNRQVQQPDWPRVDDLYYVFRKPIAPTVEANLLAIPRKQRAMVRKGMARGLRSTIDDGVDRFFALYADNVHRHGTPPLPKRYFVALRATFGADCEVLTVETADGTPVSSVLSFYFRDEVLPYFAGDVPQARDLAANDFKYWELLRRACERGYKVFDYGRSKRDTGPFAFKKNWGFEPEPLVYEYRLLKRTTVPQNNPANPKYRAFITAWRRLPRPLVNAIGPWIVRALG
ncbi:MAG: FemAB family PEP-CTERM system-associated protein [Sutterellaceae bacterium]|nr:FemAB family PEP-CTERM system-associated protein [Burkholderiaceae bacterium]MCX7901464.1 FemAB family PEP-CTERM system-associated protein [Burkholderiaceae bacterium]MDW8429327.1 FemAB family PEP-CTERM system-associated protein [Sutterellaceae bacterium]